MANPTIDDLQSPDSKILYELLSEKIENLDDKIESLEENMKDDMTALGNALTSTQNDVETIASVFGFKRNGDGKLHRPT